ncbi:MAG: phosphatidate phosphatase App1 family protein [Planctomycetota bacterium]|jgi:hypothetical protein
MRLLLVTIILSANPITSDIKPDEDVVFFNTFSHFDEHKDTWVIPIHGWIYEPERDSYRRRASLELFRLVLDLEKEKAQSRLFKKRAESFLVDNERGKLIHIRLGKKNYALNKSGSNGHFRSVLRIPARQIQDLPQSKDNNSRWIQYQAVMPEGDKRIFTGSVQLIGKTGLSVISDIDDTIKVSQVRDTKAALVNALLREFKPVPGIVNVYQQWAKIPAAFHYVSSGPWQVVNHLSEFMKAEGFPAGTMNLKIYRWKDPSIINALDGSQEHKLSIIQPIIETFPRRKFVLVGDSGEKDPEIYAELARKYPEQVKYIFIRDVTGQHADSGRYQEVFKEIAPNKWQIFHKAKELTQIDVSGIMNQPTTTQTGRAGREGAP